VTGGKGTTTSEMPSTKETQGAIYENQEKLNDTEENRCDSGITGDGENAIRCNRNCNAIFSHEMHQDDSKRCPSNKEALINFTVDMRPMSI
jgi:hypothetical protein